MRGKLLGTTSQQRRPLAAQRKMQEDKVRQDVHSKDLFLLAAVQKPTSFRTKFQRVLYEEATARKRRGRRREVAVAPQPSGEKS